MSHESTAVFDEPLIPLAEVPNHLPRRHGKRVHFSAVHRWVAEGLGPKHRKLPCIRVGRVRYTTAKGVREWCEAIQQDYAAEADAKRSRAATAKPRHKRERSDADASRAAAEAEANLERRGA